MTGCLAVTTAVVVPAAGDTAKVDAPPSGTDITIRIGIPSRSTGAATAYVLKAMLQKMFPYRFRLAPGTSEEMFAGMAAGDGSFDIDPGVWLPNDGGLWKKFAKTDKTVLANRSGYVGFQGFCVPGYVADRYGVKSVEDLTKPQIARLFDAGADGRGKMWIGAADWRETLINRAKARDYGFAPLFHLQRSPEKDFMKVLARKIAERRPVVFACYGPHWTDNEYDLAVLREPAYAPDCYRIRNPIRDRNWFRDSIAKCRGPIPRIHIAFSARLRRVAPPLARFLSRLQLRPDMVGEWATLIHDAGAPAREVAARWMEGISSAP